MAPRHKTLPATETGIKPLRTDAAEARDAAGIILDGIKQKMARRAGEFVTRRANPYTIVIARPSAIDTLIQRINEY